MLKLSKTRMSVYSRNQSEFKTNFIVIDLKYDLYFSLMSTLISSTLIIKALMRTDQYERVPTYVNYVRSGNVRGRLIRTETRVKALSSEKEGRKIQYQSEKYHRMK